MPPLEPVQTYQRNYNIHCGCREETLKTPSLLDCWSEQEHVSWLTLFSRLISSCWCRPLRVRVLFCARSSFASFSAFSTSELTSPSPACEIITNYYTHFTDWIHLNTLNCTRNRQLHLPVCSLYLWLSYTMWCSSLLHTSPLQTDLAHVAVMLLNLGPDTRQKALKLHISKTIKQND